MNQEFLLKALFIGFLALALSPIFSSQTFAAVGVTVQVSQVGENIHLEFKGQNQWDYNIEKKEEKGSTFVYLEIARLNEAAVVALKSYKSPGVEAVYVKHDGPDGKDIVTFKLKEKNLDAFDYLTDQPSRLIIDIYKNGEAPKKEAKAAAEKPAVQKEELKKEKAETAALPAKKDRQPSSDTLVLKQNEGPAIPAALVAGEKTGGIFDGADINFDRFNIKDYEIREEAMIAAKENYYIEFPMLRTSNGQLVNLNTNKPIYEIEPKENDENKQARLLKTLFDNKRYQVFLKTIEWFNQKYPQSEYNEVISFMWADVYFALWMQDRHIEDFDAAMIRYRQAIDKYPKSPLIERTLMLMGYSSMDRGDFLGTLKLFQNHIKSRPQSPNRDNARHAIAEAYMKLNRFDDAYNSLDEIEKEASNKKYQVLAGYLKGDVFFQNHDFKRAIDEYQRAQKKFPEGSTEFANSYFNQASSYFSLKNYRESLNSYIAFLKKFPSHEYAGYAMTRVGEILDILGADKSRSTGAYLETQFRYGQTPGSILAKLRLLGIRMKSMKPKEVEKAVQDIEELAKKSELNKIDQFTKVLVADGFSQRGEYDKSVDQLVKYYQANPTTADTNLLSNRIVKYINMKFQEQVDSGKFLDALQTHKKFADNWLKSSTRIDTKFNIGRAYEQAGAFKDADTMYRDSLNKITALKGTDKEKDVGVFEKVPSTDVLHLRLAEVNAQMTNFAKSYEYLRQIENPEKLSDIEQIERVSLAAQLLDKKGDPASATRYLVELIKTWKGLPELVAEPYYSLANIEMKTGKRDDAIKTFQRIDELQTDSEGKVPAIIHSQALEKMGHMYFDKGQKVLALKTYEKLLEKYERSYPYESIRYKVGQIYFERGDIQKASDTWNTLKGKKNDFWYKLAQEQLTNSGWKEDYKKYIKRIPAMSERK
jgi:tetratricopeptide (TPR) repeat protein